MTEVVIEKRGMVQWITINREARRNAINDSVTDAIAGGLAEASSDPDVRAGLSHIRKQLEEEWPIPPCEVHLAGDGAWQRMRTQDVQCHASNDR